MSHCIFCTFLCTVSYFLNLRVALLKYYVYTFTFVAWNISAQLHMCQQLHFQKNQSFSKLISFSNHNLTKVITFYESISKSKGNAISNIFLGFPGVSSYLTFKLSALKRGCTRSFKLQMPQTSSTPFWKACAKFYQGK